MIVLLFCLLLVSSQACAQEPQSLDWYYERAQEAMEAENYETAVRIIEEGKERYPETAKLNLLLADLYYDRELYKLALEEYLRAGEKEGEDYLTLVQVSRCYGKLNREQESIATLEQILELYPESVSSIDDLGWMYFKTHQLEKGEQLLLEALESYGPDRGMYMTLGTLYSGLYDYNNSKRFYLKAIGDALESDDPYFASVAYYNLSLLEHSFYHFNSALRYTEESIRSSDRAPGHLARGELFQSRLDFQRALGEYQQAMIKDTTPLSKVNLAMLYQKFGRLELARRYVEEVLGSQDLAWIYYYGTDIERHLKDVHEILADVYRGLARWERAMPGNGFFADLRSLLLRLRYRLFAYYHRQKFRLYSLQVGRSYLEENNYLDAYWEFYKGNEGYRRVALKYLRLARDMEVQVSAHAAAYYEQEEGKIRGSPELLQRSLESFDAFWEKEALYDSLRYLIPLLDRRSVERRQAITRLYRLNPGGMLQNGFALPMTLELQAGRDGSRRRLLRRTARMLRATGSEIAGNAAGNGFAYRLSLTMDSDESCTVLFVDAEQGRTVFTESVSVEPGRSRVRAANLCRSILELLYSVP